MIANLNSKPEFKPKLILIMKANFLYPAIVAGLLVAASLTSGAALAQSESETTLYLTVYERAKQELPENLYVAYRIVDRMARANGLDDTPWRVRLLSTYNINAYATEVNLIGIYAGLLDQVAGDSSALACVIGHEMAHHTRRHISLTPLERTERIEQFQAEAQAEVEAERREARNTAAGAAAGGTALQVLGGFVGGSGGNAIRNSGFVLDRQGNARMRESNVRVREIVQQKVEELEAKIVEDNHRHELEADRDGYLYMARAGFKPEGCLRLMDVLSQLPTGLIESDSHPTPSLRTENLEQLMREKPALLLEAEGRNAINLSQPLTYDRSLDRRSLRINPQSGGSTAEDLEALFGS